MSPIIYTILKSAVTLKIQSRLPKANQVSILSNDFVQANVVRIGTMVQEISIWFKLDLFSSSKM